MLIVTKARRNYLASEPNFHEKKSFSDNLWPIEIKIRQRLMNKLFYLGLLILKFNKIVM